MACDDSHAVACLSPAAWDDARAGGDGDRLRDLVDAQLLPPDDEVGQEAAGSAFDAEAGVLVLQACRVEGPVVAADRLAELLDYSSPQSGFTAGPHGKNIARTM